MFAKKIHQWNAVDVVRSDGEVHRGLVVDKQESHLLVDFDIAGKELELVPCQNAYLNNDYAGRGLVDFGSTDDAAILRKLSKDQAWKWYSGKVLIRPYGAPDFALVNIRTGDTVITDCVRSDCVRKTAYSGKPTRKNDFVKEECSVPDGFSFDSQSIAPWRKRFPRTHPIGMVGNTFHFLQLRYDKDFDVHEMTSAFGMPKEDEMDTVEDNRGVKRPHENIISNEEADCETSCLTEDFSINCLPLDVLGIVFSFLDGRQQTRIRPVCPAWNSKIISPECSREMIVDLSLYHEKDHQYILGAWLFHCITEWTKYVTMTISGAGSTESWDGSVMLILKQIMKFKNPLSALILCNMQLQSKMFLIESRTAVSDDMQTVCSRLIFKDVAILNLFNIPDDYPPFYTRTNSSYEDLSIAFGIVNVRLQKELLDCFEGAAADFTDPKHSDALELVSQAIIEANGEHGLLGDMHRQTKIINVLKCWQKSDVRFGPNTEWKHVQQGLLGANLLSLSRTTLSVLVCLAKGWKREDGENDEEDDEEEDYYDEEDDYYDGDSGDELADAYDGW